MLIIVIITPVVWVHYLGCIDADASSGAAPAVKGTFMSRETKNYRYEKGSDHLYSGNSVNHFLYRHAGHGSG
jgi:hypothetical protein